MGSISLESSVIKSTISVSIPAQLKEQALLRRIPFSATLEAALVQRIEDLERAELGGKLVPGHHPRETEATNIASRT